MSQEGRLTVIIPTWNQCELLETCLDSLANQSRPCIVLVVDNGSTDNTPQLCATRFSQFDYLRLERNFGFAKAANEGIRKTDTPYVALLNNDTEADPDWAKHGLEAFVEYPDYWFFASRMINYHNREYLDSVGDSYGPAGLPMKRGYGEKIGAYLTPEPVTGASAGAAFYRRLLFERIGLFDEDYSMYLEDVELSLRAQLQGYRCLYLPKAIVFHVEAASDRDSPAKQPEGVPKPYYSKNRVFWITRNRWQLMITYQPLRNFPQLLLGWSKSFLFHLIKVGYLGAFLKGFVAGVFLTKHALKKRRQLRQRKVISNQELCQLQTRS